MALLKNNQMQTTNNEYGSISTKRCPREVMDLISEAQALYRLMGLKKTKEEVLIAVLEKGAPILVEEAEEYYIDKLENKN